MSLSGDWNNVNDREWATVTYQAQSMRVLALDAAPSAAAPFHITGSDGMLGSLLALVAGVVCAFYGVMDFLNDGTADDPEDNKPAPDGVDSESLLHLSDGGG